jgi:hypothetical protein
MEIGRRYRYWVITASSSLAVLSIAAFFTRILPLSMSPYPFNNDSLTECGLAAKILSSGHLSFSIEVPWYGTHSGATPILNILLAYFSSVLGIDPVLCAQSLDAVIAVFTVGCIFLLGRLVSGSLRGAIVAAFAAVLMGTFVFTTGSVWKEMLGVSLLVFALLAYMNRDRTEFRILAFTILMLMPLVHHIVAAVTVLIFGYLLTWSWRFALAHRSPKRRYVEDLVLISMPVAWAALYYSVISFDRLSMLTSPVRVSFMAAAFVLVSIVAYRILSIQSHSRWTFAPIVGLGVFVLVTLDYLGYLFPYSPSAPPVYLLLVATFAFMFGLAWYGSEVILEKRPVHRSIQVALVVAPLSIMGIGMLNGLSLSSHQVLFRSFDLIDIFIFLGVSVAVVWLYGQHRKAYSILGLLMIISLLVSFPFAYMSQNLLGVRHDTQIYELDTIAWIEAHGNSPLVSTDERLAYMVESTYDIPRSTFLPIALKENWSLPPEFNYLVEDSWTSKGVNSYPNGKIVLPIGNFTMRLEASNVLYIGGPIGDRAMVFRSTGLGEYMIYQYLDASSGRWLIV